MPAEAPRRGCLYAAAVGPRSMELGVELPKPSSRASRYFVFSAPPTYDLASDADIELLFYKNDQKVSIVNNRLVL